MFNFLRKTNNRHLFWSVYYPFNFGDWIGPYLYKKISGEDAWFQPASNYSRSVVIMSAGSILSLAKRNCIVWGAGILSKADTFPQPYKILSVRGPHTKERCNELGYDCPEIYGDPGLLLPKFYSPTISKKYKLGIVPHYSEFNSVKAKFIDTVDTCIIDVRFPIENIVDELLACELVVSSSLHGLIIAHAYHVPVGWIAFSDSLSGDDVKFLDHFMSIGSNNPTCLKNALNCSADDFLATASDAPIFDVAKMQKQLMDACPFPVTNSLDGSHTV